jgi:hypothetical protein
LPLAHAGAWVGQAGEPQLRSMLSIPEFLDEHRISRSLLYRLIKEGCGPRITKIAGRTLISAEAAADWRRLG